MPIVSTSLPSDGTTIDAADVNTPFNDILNVVNGNLDEDNLADDAVTADKIADGAVTQDKLNAASLTGWLNLGATPNTVTNNGNRSYDLVFNSNDLTDTLSEGMRLKLTRTTTAPTQSTSLNGSTQYWSKTSPAGTTFTDDFCAGAWIYLTAYPSAGAFMASRYNGTSGWRFFITANGTVRLQGMNAGAANFSYVESYQSVPLNRWVHVSAQLDMSAFTATDTTSYIMIDGVNVPAAVIRGGTNPTALVQAGNLEVGSENGGNNLFSGKLAQVWYSSAKITQANIRTFMSQGITSSDVSTHSIVSAFSFNGVATDINTTNANNLSASGSAGYTSDSPFAGGSGAYETAGTTEYAIVSAKPSFSTNTTVKVQIPSGFALPTSGGVSAVSYSTQKTPYGFPLDKDKWSVVALFKASSGSISFGSINNWFIASSRAITVPTGSYSLSYNSALQLSSTVAGLREGNLTLASSLPTAALKNQEFTTGIYSGASAGNIIVNLYKEASVSLSSATTYSLYAQITTATGTETFLIRDDQSAGILKATPNFL